MLKFQQIVCFFRERTLALGPIKRNIVEDGKLRAEPETVLNV